MKSLELFKKIGYKQRYNSNSCIIYDIKEKKECELLPETVIINKGSKDIEFQTDNINEYTHLGTFSFIMNRELMQAIDKAIEEI